MNYTRVQYPVMTYSRDELFRYEISADPFGVTRPPWPAAVIRRPLRGHQHLPPGMKYSRDEIFSG